MSLLRKLIKSQEGFSLIDLGIYALLISLVSISETLFYCFLQPDTINDVSANKLIQATTSHQEYYKQNKDHVYYVIDGFVVDKGYAEEIIQENTGGGGNIAPVFTFSSGFGLGLVGEPTIKKDVIKKYPYIDISDSESNIKFIRCIFSDRPSKPGVDIKKASHQDIYNAEALKFKDSVKRVKGTLIAITPNMVVLNNCSFE